MNKQFKDSCKKRQYYVHASKISLVLIKELQARVKWIDDKSYSVETVCFSKLDTEAWPVTTIKKQKFQLRIKYLESCSNKNTNFNDTNIVKKDHVHWHQVGFWQSWLNKASGYIFPCNFSNTSDMLNSQFISSWQLQVKNLYENFQTF